MSGDVLFRAADPSTEHVSVGGEALEHVGGGVFRVIARLVETFRQTLGHRFTEVGKDDAAPAAPAPTPAPPAAAPVTETVAEAPGEAPPSRRRG